MITKSFIKGVLVTMVFIAVLSLLEDFTGKDRGFTCADYSITMLLSTVVFILESIWKKLNKE